jgi:hypothetical protein
MELRIFIARMALTFDWEFANGMTAEKFFEGQKSLVALQLPPTWFTFRPREKSG